MLAGTEPVLDPEAPEQPRGQEISVRQAGTGDRAGDDDARVLAGPAAPPRSEQNSSGNMTRGQHRSP
jgi:hypothetical protein